MTFPFTEGSQIIFPSRSLAPVSLRVTLNFTVNVLPATGFAGVVVGFAITGLTTAGSLLAQDAARTIFRVKVDMVVLSFQVTDNKGRYVNGLKPGDFKIYEDGILQSVSTFAEGPVTSAPIADTELRTLPFACALTVAV